MIIFNKTHKLRHTWDDLDLSLAMQLRAIDLPEVEDTFDWYSHLPQLREVARLMTTADPEMIPPSWIVSWHIRYWLPMWMDLRDEYPKTYTPQGIEWFRHKGVDYRLPESLDLGNDVVLQHGQTAKRFVEASNLLAAYSAMAKDGFKAAALFIATVVDEGEDFDERRIVERSKQFADLPMPTVWEVFFYTSQRLYKSMSVTLDYLTANPNTPDRLTLGSGSTLSPRQARQELYGMLASSKFGTFLKSLKRYDNW